MKVNVYSIRDVVSMVHNGLYCAPTDPAMVRALLPSVAKSKQPLEQLELYRIGSFDSELNILDSCSPVKVDWNCYRAPVEPKAQPISQEQFAQSVADINQGK